MQKRACKERRFYQTVFEPLPVKAETALYYDAHAITLPYTEEIRKLHYHNRFEIGVCEEGDGLFLVEGKFYAVSRGDIIFLPPGRRHYSRSLSPDAPCYCQFVYLGEEALSRIMNTAPMQNREALFEITHRIPALLRREQYPSLAQWIQKIVEQCRAGAPHGAWSISLYLVCLLMEAQSLFPDTCCRAALPLPAAHNTNAATAVAEHLSLYYYRSETSQELAGLCHISESQLRRQFLLAYGTSPIAYRIRLRCKIAKELLRSTQFSISEIAERIGYHNVSDFCRAFRKEYGRSPSEYKKRKNT